MYRKAPPALIVVFGASGDLARRKLIPALYRLHTQGMLPKGAAVLGYARSDYDDDSYREFARAGVNDFSDEDEEITEEQWRPFAARLHYMRGGYDDKAAFRKLAKRVAELDEEHATEGNHLFYLSTPPDVFVPISNLLTEVGLNKSANGGWSRIIIEKPFGRDLQSAKELNENLLCCFSEEQIFRIDHFLGKETVQNLLVFRFGNGIIEPIWNRNYVDHVQVTVAEIIGIGDRGGYYDEAGALRDMVQNHLLQLVALTAMEPPVSYDGKALRDQKVNVLRSIRPLAPGEIRRDVVRAQYGAGEVNGEPLVAYRGEKGVAHDSRTETFVAWKLEIDNWRWSGVPFYVRTGKALPYKVSEINVVFRRPPQMFFANAEGDFHLHRNVMTLRIQPEESIRLSFDAKRPGPTLEVDPVNMLFSYADSFGAKPADAYERLLLDALLGDGALFIRRDEVEVAWDRVTRILDGWRKLDEEAKARRTSGGLVQYEPGTWGPEEADDLLERDGRHWYNPDPDADPRPYF